MKSKIRDNIILILLLPVFILAALIALLYTPIDLVRFKTSQYSRDRKKEQGRMPKYSWLAGLSCPIRTYELFKKNGFELVTPKKGVADDSADDMYFFSGGILFWIDKTPVYDEENGRWYIENEDDPADFAVHSATKKVVFENVTGIKCDRLVYLVNEKEYSKKEKEQLSQEPSIVLYNKKNFAVKMRELGLGPKK